MFISEGMIFKIRLFTTFISILNQSLNLGLIKHLHYSRENHKGRKVSIQVELNKNIESAICCVLNLTATRSSVNRVFQKRETLSRRTAKHINVLFISI